MAKVYKLYVAIIAALALCKYCLAEGNATDETANRTVPHCHRHGDRDNCTDTGQWSGHFSKCPEHLQHYCIHGDCRYVKEQKTPSCRCWSGYHGSRCEYANLDPLIGNRQIIIYCTIAVLVLIILLIVFICICSHRRCRLCRRRRRRREEPRNGTEKLNMMDTSATNTTSTPDSTEPLHTNCV
ncbi:probetacellulin isoform X2 [Acanthochromis polyacanthus]|uniref:Betacellulin, epidermal growth factor family member n=1 Tax=Acanthochromis polyacanthus TaxID=80966 RepID=A0A3Q1G3A2_9TELE|nr:probetacellulin isoform X2 [Acanthochromis polyacanthus]